eukprot:m.35035 g.35035  ORF g.35035 m.35035 type:complete len:152 (+) comp11234_c0_seq1:30-485(+)
MSYDRGFSGDLYSPRNQGVHIYDVGHTTVEKLDDIVVSNVKSFKDKFIKMQSFNFRGRMNNVNAIAGSIVAKGIPIGLNISSSMIVDHAMQGKSYESHEREWTFDPATTVTVKQYRIGIHCHRHTIDAKGHGVPNGQESFFFLVTVNPLMA